MAKGLIPFRAAFRAVRLDLRLALGGGAELNSKALRSRLVLTGGMDEFLDRTGPTKDRRGNRRPYAPTFYGQGVFGQRSSGRKRLL